MRGPNYLVAASAAALAVLAACRHGDVGLGTLSLDRTSPGPRHLADLPARALYCARDTQLTIVTEGASWSAAITLRTEWPPRPHYQVASPPAVVGNAVVAARAIGDSVQTALVGTSGEVSLTTGPTLAGSFELTSGADSSAPRLKGSFERVPVDSAGCAS